MKSVLFRNALIISALATIQADLQAQNREIPTKKEPARTSTWGTQSSPSTQRGNSGSNSGSNTGGNSGSGSGSNRSYPTPRTNYPIFFPGGGPVFIGGSTPQSSGTTSTADVSAFKRQQAYEKIVQEMGPLVAPNQHFNISDHTKTNTISGNKGFVIEFPPFAFVDNEGNPVTGDVDIELTEYTSFSEFAASGLTCMTTTGEVLETGGMINVAARSGEMDLALSPGKEIKISNADVPTKRGFQTFYGTRSDQVLWSTTPTNNAEMDTFPFNGYTIKMLKPTTMKDGERMNFFLYKSGTSLDAYVNEKLKIDQPTKDRILKAGIPFVYTIEFNAFGKVKNVRYKNGKVENKSIVYPVNKQIISILNDAPAVTMTESGITPGKEYDIVFATAKNYLGSGVRFKTPLESPETKPNEGTVNNNPDEKNVKEFSMKSSSLGMINCDRFAGNPSTDTATMHFDNADALVYVVIKNMRSMITPQGANGDYFLTKVPKKSEVRYVAVIYDDQGDVYLSEADTAFGPGKVTFGEKTKFTAEGLKEALEKP